MPKGLLNASFEVDESADGSAPKFLVVGLEGEEEISRTYRFEIDLTCTNPNVDLAELIHAPATVTLAFKHRRKIHGVIESIEMCGQSKSRDYLYRVVLIPTMAKLAMSRQSQIYGTMGELNVLEIVKTELTGQGAVGTGEDSAARVASEDLKDGVVIENEHQVTDWVVQYRESNLNFVQRLLEHYGFFFFFDHEQDCEHIRFGDNNSAFEPLTDGPLTDEPPTDAGEADEEPKTIEYRPSLDTGVGGVSGVHSLVHRRNPVPNRLVLREYNYRDGIGLTQEPEYLHANAEVDGQAHGVCVLEGEHFANVEEGKRLAAIRAEELRCRQEIFTGTSNIYRFCPGYKFELVGHPSDACNQLLLITRVYHRAGERLPDDGPAYINEFTAIPYEKPFRPERLTPKPQVSGLLYAHVDASGTGERAEIDSMGRYKIRFPNDLAGRAPGMASRFVRMAQPYSGMAKAGDNTGMHFPLKKGTEVIIACVNGDPNRPIIVGTVPNAKSGSPVTGRNNTKNQIRTASGILMEFEDGTD